MHSLQVVAAQSATLLEYVVRLDWRVQVVGILVTAALLALVICRFSSHRILFQRSTEGTHSAVKVQLVPMPPLLLDAEWADESDWEEWRDEQQAS